MPRSILEAGACERPIVATEVGGVSQVIKPGETGVLVPARQPQRLAEEIINLVQDRCLGERYGQNVRQWVSLKFSESEFMEKLAAIYEEVVAETRLRKN
jgi:glycosyltransferase involved in cell wall biosynthesis